MYPPFTRALKTADFDIHLLFKLHYVAPSALETFPTLQRNQRHVGNLSMKQGKYLAKSVKTKTCCQTEIYCSYCYHVLKKSRQLNKKTRNAPPFKIDCTEFCELIKSAEFIRNATCRCAGRINDITEQVFAGFYSPQSSHLHVAAQRTCGCGKVITIYRPSARS